MKSSIGVVVLAILYNVIPEVRSACDDADSTSCALFMKARPDMCMDKCLSTLCPRTCGTCPLKCYNCASVDTPENCNSTMICTDQDHYCVESQTLTSDFRLAYKLGCAHRDVCSLLFSSGQPSGIIGKRQGLQGECCQSDLCNHHPPGAATPAPKTTTAVPMTPAPTTDMPPMTTEDMTTPMIMASTLSLTTDFTIQDVSGNSACADVSRDACLRLSVTNKAMCNDACVVQVCPRTCGKCAECYTCSHSATPEACNQTSTCLAGEECYVLETLSTEGQHSYNLGCMKNDACSRFHTQAGQVFGKRGDTFELSVKGDCCVGDLCNHKELMPNTGTGTQCVYGGAGHHCPDGYTLIDGKCFMVSSKSLTYDDAESYCTKHCGKLAEQLSSTDISTILYFLKAISGHSTSDLYIGLVDKDHSGRFSWASSSKVVYYHHRTRDHYCATIPSSFHGSFSTTSCSSHHQALCQAAPKK